MYVATLAHNSRPYMSGSEARKEMSVACRELTTAFCFNLFDRIMCVTFPFLYLTSSLSIQELEIKWASVAL